MFGHVQEPISRHQSGHRGATGKTSMVPRSNLRTQKRSLDDGNNSFFRHHARAGQRLRAHSGVLGDGEEGNVYGTRKPLGSDPATWSPSGGALGHPERVGRVAGGASFGTPDTKRQLVDLIEDIGENKPRKRGESRVRQAIDIAERMRRPYGGKIFHKSPCWKRGNCL